MRIRAPFVVGRDQELAELRKVVDGALAGNGRAAFIVGEAGIGKSRLADEVVGWYAGSGVRVSAGRSTAIGPMTPFRPLTEALLSLFRTDEPPDDPALRPYRPALGRLIPHWADEGPQQPVSVALLAEAILRLTDVVGRPDGCLMLLEDLHDADVETLSVLEYLVDNLEWQRTALLVTLRTDPGDAVDLVSRAAQRDACTVIELGRLRRAETDQVVAACLGATPDALPGPVTGRLWDSSAGVPFVIEELLRGMLASGALVGGLGGWRLASRDWFEVPATLTRSIASRTDRLCPQGRLVLWTAAVLGRRFPLAVVQAVTRLDGRALLRHVRAGMAAQLLTHDELSRDWYAFQHPLTVEALLGQLTPAERAGLSTRAADAIERLHPGLPGEWCQRVAVLRLDGGDTVGSARLFAQAGRRALADGATDSALGLLSRADELLAGQPDSTLRADVLETLLYVLAEADQLDRACALVESLDERGQWRLDSRRRAALHVRLARVANLAGRWADGFAQVEAARSLLGPEPAMADIAPVDAIAAELTLQAPGPDRTRRAETLARRALAAALQVSLPDIACQAWTCIGLIVRERDVAEGLECFRAAVAVAERDQLPIWRLRSMLYLACFEYVLDGDPAGLLRVRQEILRAGAISLARDLDAILALHKVLVGEYELAAAALDRCWSDVARLKIIPLMQYVQVIRVTLAAHQGDRRSMEAALAEFDRWNGERPQETAVAIGLGRTYCALLEENRELARRELDALEAFEASDPTTFQLTGRHGLQLLLTVLDGDAGWPGYRRSDQAVVGELRWNRQFVLLARAVLLGRDRRAAEAVEAVTQAQQAAEAFPLTRHLGLRLVAEAAHDDGWGQPVAWLRTAEEYFHRAGITPVAARCRALLRRYGAPVPQRRNGTDRVPHDLRALGMTIREYEVFELLVQRLGNKAVARRLHISPRTVEKHIANLIVKTSQTDRHALCDYAARVLCGARPGAV